MTNRYTDRHSRYIDRLRQTDRQAINIRTGAKDDGCVVRYISYTDRHRQQQWTDATQEQ